jgi:hypothetical protein
MVMLMAVALLPAGRRGWERRITLRAGHDGHQSMYDEGHIFFCAAVPSEPAVGYKPRSSSRPSWLDRL